MMPQNLNALFSALSGQPSGFGLDGRRAESGSGTWAEALAAFQSSAHGADATPLISGELPGEGASESDAVALDWLERLAALGDLLDTISAEEGEISAELMAELEGLLGLLDESLLQATDSALMTDLQGEIEAGLAQLLAQVATLMERSSGQSDGRSRGAAESALAFLTDWREALSGLQPNRDEQASASSRASGGAAAAAALAAARESLVRAHQERSSSARDAALSRLAELTAMTRAALEAARGQGGQDLNRSVLLSQQFQSLTTPLPGSSAAAENAGQFRVDAQAGPLAAARDPALPPTSQLPGTAAAGAGEARAASAQAMERVVWMAARQQGLSQARLQLHPAHLGKVDIRLDVQGREASVVLNVQNGPVREAMEAMLPRLREQLEEQGLQLGDASVFDSGPGDASPEQSSDALLADADGRSDDEQEEAQVETNLRGRGLLDTYA